MLYYALLLACRHHYPDQRACVQSYESHSKEAHRKCHLIIIYKDSALSLKHFQMHPFDKAARNRSTPCIWILHGSEFKNWNFGCKPSQTVLYYTWFHIYLCSCGNDKRWTSGTRSLRVTAGCINLIYILPPWEKSFDFMEAIIRRRHALWVSAVLSCRFTQHMIWLLFKS